MQSISFGVLLAGAAAVTAMVVPEAGVVPRLEQVDLIEQQVTSVVYQTQYSTVYNCGPNTNCPGESTVVVTSVVPIATTICPITLTSTRTVTQAPSSSTAVPTSAAISSSPASGVTPKPSSSSGTSSSSANLPHVSSSAVTYPNPEVSTPASSSVASSEQDTTVQVTTLITQSVHSTLYVTLTKGSSSAAITPPAPTAYPSSQVLPTQSEESMESMPWFTGEPTTTHFTFGPIVTAPTTAITASTNGTLTYSAVPTPSNVFEGTASYTKLREIAIALGLIVNLLF